ncbi:MAG: diguanylate cyclase [Deltaproteobacteria bacterium]|nr:diguanylate cyclase [Deltaproteobacteria bacterium]
MFVSIKDFFQKLPIRHKFIITFTFTVLLALALGSIIIYSVVRNTLKNNIESELEDTTQTVVNMVKSATEISIKNSLHAIADKNRDIVKYYYKLYKKGRLTEKAAKKKAVKILLNEKIGKNGYIYCLSSKGTIKVHPKAELINSNFIDFQFIREQISRKEGFLEYKWANPEDIVSRPKALYMTYFKEWDWIISATSYREEFTKFINIEDFRPYIQTLSVGKSGYVYVMNSKGSLVIHPNLQGKNIYNSADKKGRKFIKEICDKKNGITTYPWKAPWEKNFKERIVMFQYIPELDWIVASSGFLDELYKPLRIISFTILITAIVMLGFVFLITLGLSYEIARPLSLLIKGLEAGAEGDYTTRVEDSGEDEFKKVRNYFNIFMDALQTAHLKLSSKVHELEKRNRESSLLRRMSEMIQSCNTKKDVYGVIGRYMEKFFPEESGQFYILNRKNSFFESVVSWGHDREDIWKLEFSDCMALSQGKPFLNANENNDIDCKHCDRKSGSTLCMPMIIQGETAGLIVQHYHEKNYPLNNGNIDKQIHYIMLIIVEHLSLALSNIKLRETLHLQSIVDPLTGLYNRRYLEDRVKEESGRVDRHKFPVGILMLDVDNFKIFNDTYGHECGDIVLKELGYQLKKNVRVEDVLCRYGGEEFIAILILSSYEATCKKAEELCSIVRNDLKIIHQGKELSVTISIGVASCPEHGKDIEKAILLADTMLYKAKSEGRDRVAVLPADGYEM